MGFAGCIPRFLKANAGWVLTALGSAGLIGTVILSAKEAPEAKAALIDAEDKKSSEFWTEDYNDNSPVRVIDEKDVYLTNWEKVKIAFPIYLPAILTGLGTLGCFWGSQIFNARKQTALVAAYGALAMQFDQYREAIRAEHGEEADKRAFEISQTEARRLREEITKLKEKHGPFLYEFASLPGVIFEARPDQISEALMHYNRNCMLRGGNDLEELYRLVGIPESCYDKKIARQYGWQEYENEAGWAMSYVDFFMKPVTNRYGRTVYIIGSVIPPYEVEVDYGFEGSVENHFFDGYDPELAESYAKEYGEAEVVQISEARYCYAPGVG